MSTSEVLGTPSTPVGDLPDLVPARMLNEFVYCPRLAYLEWVQGEFADSVDTVDGRFQHRRVDVERGAMPPAPAAAVEGEPDAQAADLEARSVMLSAPQLGLIARIDLVEGEGTRVAPVDYKRGSRPRRQEGAWDPERVQLCAQGLILRENGYSCDEGVLYFVESKTRVTVPFDDALVALTLAQLEAMREMARAGSIPPPLVDSPKCPRCSLVGICLPDEVHALNQNLDVGEIRRMYAPSDDGLPVYVCEPGGRIGKESELLRVRSRTGETIETVRLFDMTQLSIFGNVSMSAQALREVSAREIPIFHFSHGGWFFAVTQGLAHKNIELRREQFRQAGDPERCLALARSVVVAKVKNCRTVLRRNHPDLPSRVVKELARLGRIIERAASLATLLGLEGASGRAYFSHFAGMLKGPEAGQAKAFDFRTRNRRPPTDPVNALLSFGYSLLTKELTLAATSVGLDPYLGFYHQPRYGRPALALDLMEEFRPIVVDSVVLSTLNTGELRGRDFIARGGAVALTDVGRRRFIQAYERRLDELIVHPVFGYPISYRRVMHVQARLLTRFLLGEIPAYPAFRTR